MVGQASSGFSSQSRSTSKRSAGAVRTTYMCTECGWSTGKWVGRCGECQTWGSVAESRSAPAGNTTVAGPVTSPAIPITDVPGTESAFTSSGVGELDRVLGGGLVPGAALLLAGEPGVGKSTLLLEVAAQTARTLGRVLYVTGEESAAQVRLRADRTNGVHERLYLAAETDLGAVLSHVEQTQPTLLVVDSVQTISAPGVDGVPGGVSQVKEVAAALVRTAKSRNITTILVGHATKEGSIAGPRVMEHLVDVVLHFEGERNSRFRMVRAIKNRFGPVDEIGCFDLHHEGITPVTDPTGLFVEHHHEPIPGTCVAQMMEGRRPLLAEVQALVAATSTGHPRRTTSGVDSNRLAMVLAVLQQHVRLPVDQADVFVSTVGGARLGDPATDLAIAVAIASSVTYRPPPSSLVALGEIGLAGELRRVRDLPQRLTEAARLGFETAVVPLERDTGGGSRKKPRTRTREVGSMTVIEAAGVRDALQVLGLTIESARNADAVRFEQRNGPERSGLHAVESQDS